jgi:hypothetical protein
MFGTVCAERGYTSIDENGRTECDICAFDPGSLWLEIETCWSVRGWNNKPSEQSACWQNDIEKLSRIPRDADRCFLLVGFFGFDPLYSNEASRDSVLQNIKSFHPDVMLLGDRTRLIRWRNEAITHVGIWVWKWGRGVRVGGVKEVQTLIQ